MKLPKRPQKSHKGTFGKVLNVAGSCNYRGAAYLSSASALKIGAGYVSLACPKELVNDIASFSPDITFLPLSESILANLYSIEAVLPKFDVLSLGCGMSTDKRIVFFVSRILDLLQGSLIPVVIDADGINSIFLSGHNILPENTIITPHEAELSRLLQVDIKEIFSDREYFAKKASQQFGCVTVLKGHNTIICSKNLDITINETGNSALAKAGSGDVLTGMISGLLAQGVEPYEAACLGVYLHGLTGEIASKELSEYGVFASDLLRFLPKAVTKTL